MQAHTATAAQVSKFPAAAFGLRTPSARVPAGSQMQMILAKGEELFAEGDEADYFYQVVSGAIRTYKQFAKPLCSAGSAQFPAIFGSGNSVS
jgi:CRP/FNR family nitrogen fixation transcriptional regulator